MIPQSLSAEAKITPKTIRPPAEMTEVKKQEDGVVGLQVVPDCREDL
jgi:hypothetical protein